MPARASTSQDELSRAARVPTEYRKAAHRQPKEQLPAMAVTSHDLIMANKSTSAAIETQSKKVADSARKLKESSVRIEDSADRRTELASNRTALAAERTYSAWIRTGLFALASGAGARGVLTGLMPDLLIKVDGSALVAFSIFCFCAAVWRIINSGAVRPEPDVRRIDDRILIAMSVFLSLVSLAALWGIWLA
jgi:putative membrane protein